MNNRKYLLSIIASILLGINGFTQNKSAIMDKKNILLVGSYTEKMGWVEGMATGIGVYEFDTETGKLKLINTSAYIKNPSYLAIHPNKQYVYAVSETEGDAQSPFGKLFAYRFDTVSYQLQSINSVSSKGTSPCFVSIDKTGKYALVANYGNGSVAAYAIGSNGELSNAFFTDQHTGKGPRPQQTNAHAHNFVTSPNNRFAYSADLGSDQIYHYQFNALKGTITPFGSNIITAAGAGPRQMYFHPSLNMAYVINELNGTIGVYNIERLTGNMQCIQTISTLADSSDLPASGAEIRISSSGRFLYASNRAKHNNIAIYSIDQQTGMLTLKGHHSTHGITPRFFTFDPSGQFILIANQDSNNVVVFRIDQHTGLFIEPGIINDVPTPTCLMFYY